MKKMTLKLGAIALALVAGSPALAQMASGDMKMTKSQMATMKKCQGMSHAMMMKSKTCTKMAKMAKMHPEMMSGDATMQSDGMMKK